MAYAEEFLIVDWDYVEREDTYNQKTGGCGGNGMVMAKNQSGKNIFVSSNDPRYISGELVGIAHGMVTVKDKSGNHFLVDKSDPRYISGELVHFATGNAVVRDKDGNNMRVSKNDPRILSGELICVNKGRIHKTIVCPHCGKNGGITIMRRWHFDNCKNAIN